MHVGNDGFQNVPPGPLEVMGADTFPAALPILWGMCGVVEGFQLEGTPNGHGPWAPGEVRKEKGVTTTGIFPHRLRGWDPRQGCRKGHQMPSLQVSQSPGVGRGDMPLTQLASSRSCQDPSEHFAKHCPP